MAAKWNNQDDKHLVTNAIADLRGKYPFPEIIDDTGDTIKAIALVIKRLVSSPGRILDLGCGAMDKVMVYQKIGYQCCAADDFQDAWHRDQNNLSPVTELAKSFGIEVYAQESPLQIPWDKESFDAVTIINVIEHLHESPRDMLNLAGDYLKPGGLLLVVMPNSVNFRKRMSVVFGRSNYTPVRGLYEFEGIWRGHTREYTLQETRLIIEWTGFDVVSSNTFHGLLNTRLKSSALRFLFKAFCLVAPGFRDSVLVAARKPNGWIQREPDPDALKGISGHDGFA